MRFATSLGLAILGCTACATTPVSDFTASFVPRERIIDPTYLANNADTGQVTVKRDSGLNTSACSSRLFVNAKPVADLRTSEKIVLHLPPGEYIFSALANGICAGGLVEARGTVRAGGAIAFRIGYGTWGEFTISPTAF